MIETSYKDLLTISQLEHSIENSGLQRKKNQRLTFKGLIELMTCNLRFVENR